MKYASLVNPLLVRGAFMNMPFGVIPDRNACSAHRTHAFLYEFGGFTCSAGQFHKSASPSYARECGIIDKNIFRLLLSTFINNHKIRYYGLRRTIIITKIVT